MADITRKRGDTKSIVFRFSVSGVAMDLDGCSFLMTVDPAKDPADDTDNILQLTGTALTDGRVQFDMTELEADITPGTYYYDVQITDADGKISTPDDSCGKFKIVQDITK
jgi:hypothetical protein